LFGYGYKSANPPNPILERFTGLLKIRKSRMFQDTSSFYEHIKRKGLMYLRVYPKCKKSNGRLFWKNANNDGVSCSNW